MYSGGDSSDGINSLNNFAAYGFVNQVAVTNAMAAGQNIDWAQLAQQWIQMRDNSELNVKKDSNLGANKISEPIPNSFTFEEKGEADMDMDDEEQSDDKALQKNSADFATSSITNTDFNQTWFFGEDNSHNAVQTSSNNQWNPWPSRENLPNQNHANNQPTTSISHIPSLLKISVPHPNEIRVMPDMSNQANNANMMDAAKRKGLPAWIREGLEKMEREKQKQLGKAHQNKNMKFSDDENSSNTNIVTKSTSSLGGIPTTVLLEESTDNEDEVIVTNLQSDINFKKGNGQGEKCSSSEDKTYEQKLSELMIVVRTTLTELLLETTNEEIFKVADETIKIFKSKASSAQVIRKSALSTLTDKLGLAAYGDSSSEDDSDNDGSKSSKKTTGQSESDNDSDEQIRNLIRVKRKAFIKTSEEIEDRVALAAAREEEKLKYFLRKEEEEKEYAHGKLERSLVRDPSNSGNSGHNMFIGYEKDFGEITETKIQHPNGKRQKERSSRRERITRFSDNKDKYVALPNAASFLTNLSSATNFPSGNSSTTAATSNSQQQNIPDINGLLPSYKNTGMTNVLNAADAALEKALKAKAPSDNENQSRRYERDRSYYQSKKRRRSGSKCSRSLSKSSSSSTSSSSSSTSSESNSSSTSRSSHSKYKHRSSKKHKSHTHVERQHRKSHPNSRSKRKYQSSSYKKRDRESTSSRNRRNLSSDSEDDYRRRYRSDSKSTRNSSHIRSHTSSTRTQEREHSRSQSRSSYSSNNRRQ